ncbi:MAG: carboxynorspermidine decarboxylase [Patescibacteria group bacterium]|jgi:carboxynorspermidine decarboxylase
MSNINNRKRALFTEPWIDISGWRAWDFKNLETPAYVVDEKILLCNLKILARVQKESGCEIIMALKGFSMWSVFPLVKKYLPGIAASSVNEARLGHEKFRGEVHTFSPAYAEKNIHDFIEYSDHLIFNSFSQWKKFRKTVLGAKKKISCGLRVNPEHSETETPMYDPAAPFSRLGVTKKNFQPDELDGIEGLHFHTLCELGPEPLDRTLRVFEKKFGRYLSRMKWVNFGGGHHITRRGYDTRLLVKIIKDFKIRHPHLKTYLEPGEAIALNAGVLVSSIVDIINNKMNIAILDVSAATHMPDVLEMPYEPTFLGADAGKKYEHVYRLAGPSCLAGDIIGDYSFKKPLKIGDKIIFMNMAIYTMVKNNTFNGIGLPSILIRGLKNKIRLVKKFGYEDFKNRLS